VRLGGKRIASIWAKSVGSTSTNGTIYYHRDSRGSVVATTTAGGNIGISYRYLPSGAVDKTIGTEADETASELGFIGGIKLSGGLVHLRARVYSTFLRRFLQPDTVDLIRYTYARGDFLNYADPSGRYRAVMYDVAPRDPRINLASFTVSGVLYDGFSDDANSVSTPDLWESTSSSPSASVSSVRVTDGDVASTILSLGDLSPSATSELSSTSNITDSAITADGPEFRYSQETGLYSYINADGGEGPVFQGYSGSPSWDGTEINGRASGWIEQIGGQGLNNPAAQAYTNAGPIPQGEYEIGDMQTMPSGTPNALPLTPLQSTNTYGRGDFWEHDGNMQTMGASEGCIALPLQARIFTSTSGVTLLRVGP